MLEIQNISYSYEKLKIFENISFSIEKWVVWIYWPSGSGKTTFLKTVWWYIKPLSWGVFLDWKNIENIKNYKKQNWFHFQNFNLIDLDVKTNLQLPFLIGKQQQDKDWINYLIDHFEIWNLLDNHINHISWGEKERVSIVKAFANKPNIIFLDEAWSALDERLKFKVFEFIKDYWKKHIVFLITHYDKTKDFFWFEKTVYDNNFHIIKQNET